MNMKKKRVKLNFNFALLAILAVLFIGITVSNPVFVSFDYLVGVMLRNIVEIGTMALPVTLIVITGGIDLSVGSTMVLSAMAGGMVAAGMGTVAGLIASLLVGAACGLFNGFLVAKMKISPLVATLATMYLYMGIARGFSKGDNVYAHPIAEWLGNAELLGVPVQIFIYAVLALMFWFLLSKTVLGRELYGIGLNENATNYSGINTVRVKMLIYLLSSVLCALAGMIWLGRFTSVKYDAGTSLGLKVVTIIVLGGTSILGGSGDMRGTVLATLIIAVLNSGLNVAGLAIDKQTIVHGLILVVSLLGYAVLSERARKSRIIDLNAKQDRRTQAL